MSNNRKLGNLAQFLDSGSTKSVITVSGGAFATEPLLEADLTGIAPTGLSDSNLVKNLVDINYITETTGYASVSDAIPVILQNTNNIIPDSSGAYDLGDSAKPIAELILDSSANIFFGALSLTSVLKSGTSAIAVAAAAAASTVAGSAETSFLLKTDSTQSDAQSDASTNALTITENGNVTSTAFTPYHPKGYSHYVNGTTDYWSCASSADFTLDGEFTIEFWVYLNQDSYARTIQRVITPNSGTYSGAPYISIGNDLGITGSVSGVLCTTSSVGAGNPQMHANTTGTSATGTAVQFPLKEWVHVALTRDSNNDVKLFQNGTLVATSNITANFDYNYTSNGIILGRSGWAPSEYLGPAYLTDFRIVKGTAVYTSAFTAPTERLTAVTNTKLLTFNQPYVGDGSTSARALTVYGSPLAANFNMFDHVAYSPSSHGGSVYFDGSGDYLTTSSNIHNSIGTGDFTAEAWVYLDEAIGSNRGIFGSGSSDVVDEFTLLLLTNGSLYFDYGATQDYVQTGAVFKANTWHHVALTRSGTSFNIWLNGTSVASATLSANIGGSSNFAVGWGRGIVWKGYISDARVVTGTAVYTAAFTPPTQPLTAISGTQLLTCTNKNSIYDAAAGQDVTATGDAAASTTQYKWSSSTAFDDNGDYLTATVDPPGTGDYTLECWVRFNSMSAGNQSILSFGNYSPAIYYRSASSELAVYYSSAFYLSGFTPVADTWYHIAWTRSGTSCRLFVDGIQKGTTASNAHNVNNTNLRIGYDGVDYFGGYIEDVRYTKGLARYTADFTPPTAALEG